MDLMWLAVVFAVAGAGFWSYWISRGNQRQTALALATSAGLLALLALPGIAEAGSGGESAVVASLREFLPIAILLVVIAIVLLRLPRIDLGHSDAFRRRRVLNWLPLGLTYAFLYMGRYNLTVSKSAFQKIQDASGGAIMGNDDFGIIFAAGTIVYGCSFLINGPLTDRLGGKFAILVGAAGAAILNAIMGLATWSMLNNGPGAELIIENFTVLFSVLYAGNMYFQSFGAVAIVKVNAPWFHVQERGVFGAIFGILISLGIYFAFDWGKMIKDGLGLTWVFFIPAILLAIFWVIDTIVVRNTPGEAGHEDFDTADASSGDDGPRLPVGQVFIKMMSNPIIVTIACIEFCSGFLRQAIMQWYRAFAEQTNSAIGLVDSIVYEYWGTFLCAAGILGGVVAGVISDRVFDARRGPVAGLLYGAMLVGAVLMTFTYHLPMVSWLVIIMSMAVIGVHGMLSGTASMDFGGKKNVGVAVGIIDGFVYLGTGTMALTYGFALPKEQIAEVGFPGVFDYKLIVGPASDPSSWSAWPILMIPFALLGFVLALRVWNAKPKPKSPPKASSEAPEARVHKS